MNKRRTIGFVVAFVAALAALAFVATAAATFFTAPAQIKFQVTYQGRLADGSVLPVPPSTGVAPGDRERCS